MSEFGYERCYVVRWVPVQPDQAILDAHEANAYGVSKEAQDRLRDVVSLAGGQPELFVSAAFALLNAAISLPQLVPAPLAAVPEIRRTLERKAYEDIGQMEPPTG